MLGTGLGIGTAALIGDSYVHTFAAFSTFTALSLGESGSGSEIEGGVGVGGDIDVDS